MKNLTKGIAAVGALAMLTGVGACGSNTADDKGHVYFLNNKPEVVNQWNELAEMYTKQTGVKVDIQLGGLYVRTTGLRACCTHCSCLT